MIRLLIVDDEAIIREGICKGVDWASIGIEVLPPADCGEAALAIARNAMPDIIITDIMMPDMTGIELISALKQLNPDLQSVILSGYDNFDYAQKAIELNVEKYILKPISPQVLLETVNTLVQSIQKAQKQEEEYNLFKTKFYKNFENLRDSFLKSILLQQEEMAEDINNEKELFRIGENKEHYIVLCININTSSKTNSAQYYPSLALEDIKSFHNDNLEVYLIGLNYIQSVAVLFSKNPNELLPAIKNITEYIKTELKLDVSVGSSNVSSDFSMLPHALQEAFEAISYRFMFRNTPVISINDVLPEQMNLVLFPQKELDNLLVALKNRGIVQFDTLIKQLFAPLRQATHLPASSRLQFTIEFVAATLQTIELYKIPIEGFNKNEFWNQVISVDSIDECEEIMHKLYSHIYPHDTTVDRDRIILHVKNFIEENYAKKFRLEELATPFHISYSHLSLMFKQETGYNASEYLTLIRIEHAKKMLADTNLKITAISSSVGFEDSHYFSRVFKKNTGYTPNQYREKKALS